MIDHNEIIEIDFEVGHSSIIRTETTTMHNPPRTHDWKVYLRSADINGDLNCLIQRCIFHLHPEFPNNKRELKTTPFAIQESGYAGFHLPIEVYFKTKTEPRKFLIEYDLDLHRNIDGHPCRQKESYVRRYRCSFYDPDSELRQKILAAGGKIVDSGPIVLNNIDTDEGDRNNETISRHSPQQKRAISPATTPNVVSKKAKLEPSTNKSQKKPVQSMMKNEHPSKTIVNMNKSKLVSCKSSSVVGENLSKTQMIKQSNPLTNISGNPENLPSVKSRPSIKLIKSQSTNDMKSSSQSTSLHKKKKEVPPSPSKTKLTTKSQNVLKRLITKNPQKTSIKIEQTSIPTVQSTANITIKQESLSQPPPPSTTTTDTTATSVSINTLKKIPKKPLSSSSSSVVEKRSRSLMPSSSLNRTSTRDSQKPQSSVSKTQLKSKQDRSSTTVNKSRTNHRSEKTTIPENRSDSNSSRSNQSKRPELSLLKTASNEQKTQTLVPSKSTRSPDQSDHEPSMNFPVSSLSSMDTVQPLSVSSSSSHVVHNEDTSPLTTIDKQTNENPPLFFDKSNSPHEQSLFQSNPILESDRSDTSDNETSQTDHDDEEDLPSSLTNDDLRYKLIYIYKRFQLNSIHDLIIFVQFFKRHQLIDISTLSMTKTSEEMFTYDLFCLSPSHIGELANDLGYVSTNMINSIK